MGVDETSVAGDAERGGFIFILELSGTWACVSAKKKVLGSKPAFWGSGRRLGVGDASLRGGQSPGKRALPGTGWQTDLSG